MRIREKRLLRGPNLYATGPCLMAVVDNGAAKTGCVAARLRALLPADAILRLADEALLVEALTPVVMELQRLAGAPGAHRATLTVTGQAQRRRVVCGYAIEQVALEALRVGVAVLDALAHDMPFDLEAALAELRDTAAHHAIGASTGAVLDAAERRGIPALRLDDAANLFQLGWGSRQKRLLETMTGTTGSIAVGISGDRQLTRALLAQAGVPVARGEVVTSVDAAQRAARRLGGPVTVKPLDARQLCGTTVDCATADAVARAFSIAREHGRRVIVEEYLRGRGYRVLVTGGKVAAVAWRRPPDIVGDGVDDVTALLAQETRELCIRAARTIGLDVAGIDIVCQDIAQPLRAQGGGIVGVNAAPDLGIHHVLVHGQPRDAGDALVEAMFGGCDGRIPVVAVTGTNGKTTTSLLIEHTVRLAGLRTGVTTTSGVYLNGQLAYEGDCTGYHSARSVLGSPEVDFAVLETARGGILKRGLAYDRCDVSVVLNVSADHLGLDGVDTLDDLARVKAVVAKRASRAVVLNAEDAYCVRMAADLAAGVEVIYFALDAEDPVLVRHVEHGGRGVYLQDTTIVVASGARHDALVDVREMPVSLGGRARYNIANAMAAAAALIACGFSNREVADGLRGFVSDSKHNPLRSNLFDVDGVTVVVDFAHNCAAYAALAEMARAMTPGRLIGVVAAPGDRRDADLIDIGRTCAAGFDELVVYESENRGRRLGETAALLARGARLGKIDSEQLRVELNVHRAIRLGLSMCRPGDVLVFGCGSSLSELTDALRPTRPDLARQIDAAAI